MMACMCNTGIKVHSSSYEVPTSTVGLELPKLKQPVATAPYVMESWHDSYVAHKKNIGEQKIQVKSGNTYGYWIDGELTMPHCVLAFHDVGNCKSQFLQPSSLPHIFLIAIDRLGHGASSPEPENWTFEKAIPEIIEILDLLKVDTVHVVGHGHGGIWALQTAAALGDRVVGCATLGTPNNINHALANKKDKSLINSSYSIKPTGKSCARYVHSNKSVDFGMAAFYDNVIKTQHGGDERSWAALDHNLFSVCSLLDSALYGAHTASQPYQDYNRMVNPWHYDISNINCHTYIYHGYYDNVYKIGNEKALTRQIGSNASKVTMIEHGHSTIILEFPKIVNALCRRKKVESSFHRSHVLMPAAIDKMARDGLAVVATTHAQHQEENHEGNNAVEEEANVKTTAYTSAGNAEEDKESQ
jgi:pimeloyl-ACP methyl ester carboxylesterase